MAQPFETKGGFKQGNKNFLKVTTIVSLPIANQVTKCKL